MQETLLGGIAVACLVAGLFFLGYWRSSGDRFFVYFVLSFWIQAANHAAMAWTGAWNEDAPAQYLVRALAYALILCAIWEKNRMRR
jgi:hypothetical protein